MEIPRTFLRVISSSDVAFSLPEGDLDAIEVAMRSKTTHRTIDIFGAPCIINCKWIEGVFMSSQHSREMFNLYEKMLESEEPDEEVSIYE